MDSPSARAPKHSTPMFADFADFLFSWLTVLMGESPPTPFTQRAAEGGSGPLCSAQEEQRQAKEAILQYRAEQFRAEAERKLVEAAARKERERVQREQAKHGAERILKPNMKWKEFQNQT